MDTFPIEERLDGDYRTKRVILEIYDAMAEAIRTGFRSPGKLSVTRSLLYPHATQ